MRPIKLKLFNDISDSFYYMGKLFLLTCDRQLKAIDNQVFFERYMRTNNEFDNELLEKIFFANDQLNDYSQFNNDAKYSQSFNEFWLRYVDKDFQVHIDEQDLTLVCELPEQEGLDFVIYAQRAYIANRDGMYECRLAFEGMQVQSLGGFNKVFDAKSININPRAGHLLVSTKSEGLFSASLGGFDERLQVREKAIEQSSVRTGWVNYNFVNYRNQTEADLILNDTEDEKSSDISWFKADDIGPKDKKITKIGSEKDDISVNIANASKNSEVIFSFNSLTNSFAITKDGRIFYSKFLDEDSRQQNRLSIYRSFRNINFDIGSLGRPLSAHTVAGGTLYEFFEKVILLKNGEMQVVSDFECSQVRTFASSKWFKNIAMALGEDHLDVHCIHPYL